MSAGGVTEERLKNTGPKKEAVFEFSEIFAAIDRGDVHSGNPLPLRIV